MKKLGILIYLNFWALLLYFSAIVLSIIIYRYQAFRPNIAILVIEVIIIFYIFTQATVIQGSLGHKLNAYYLLLKRTQRKFELTRFAPYMVSPCGKQVVKAVLKDSGNIKSYKEIKDKYGKPFLSTFVRPWKEEKKVTVRIYKNGKKFKTIKHKNK